MFDNSQPWTCPSSELKSLRAILWLELPVSASAPSPSGRAGAQLAFAPSPTMNSCHVIGPAVFSAPPCFTCCQSLPVALLCSGCHYTPGTSKHGDRDPWRPLAPPLPSRSITQSLGHHACALHLTTSLLRATWPPSLYLCSMIWAEPSNREQAFPTHLPHF